MHIVTYNISKRRAKIDSCFQAFHRKALQNLCILPVSQIPSQTRMQCFFEIYSEEIPAMMQLDAQKQLKDLLEKFFSHIDYESIETFVTPQRLVGYIQGLSSYTKEKVEWIRGPKVNMPPEIVTKFCQTQGIKKELLVEKEGHFYFEKKTPAILAKEILTGLIPYILESFSWPKVMKWPQSEAKWVRPIRSVMMILNGEPLFMNVPMLGLKTSDFTIGHRFLSPSKISPKTFEDYKASLKEHYVILDHQERQNIIKENLQGAELDKELLEENAGLTEWPVVKKGQIASEFMTLPSEVLKTVMKKHQKYFFFANEPAFLAVCNVLTDNVIKGYERVLRARLNDARFFYNEDLKTPLKKHDLSKIVFYKGLGTIEDKVDRMLSLTKDADEQSVIRLCKKDLLTQMVYEFPELEGVMGSVYAKAQGTPSHIADAILDHMSLSPETELGAKVALLDRLDSLVGLIGTGVKISGSKDPYGLRRHALTIIRIYEKFPQIEPLEGLIAKSLKKFKKLPQETAKIVEDFIYSRLKIYYQDDALYVQIATSRYPLHELRNASLQIKALLTQERAQEFLQGFKRLLGLLKVTKVSGEILPLHKEERALYDFIMSGIQLDNLIQVGQHLQNYFNEVTVNEGATHIVQSRQNLLFSLKQKIDLLGDFSIAV